MAADIPTPAQSLYPNLPSAASGAPEQPAPAADRSAADVIYGVEPPDARAVARSGEARPAPSSGEPPRESGGKPTGAADWLGRALGADAPAKSGSSEQAPASGSSLNLEALGLDADLPLTTEFQTLAGELKITQAAAEKLLPLHQKALAEASESYWSRQASDWEAETRQQFGSRLDGVVATVTPLLNDPALTTPGFLEVLSRYGLGSHPDVVATLANWANAMRRRW